jgi:integral membrane sensor domain MASE1
MKRGVADWPWWVLSGLLGLALAALIFGTTIIQSFAILFMEMAARFVSCF